MITGDQDVLFVICAYVGIGVVTLALIAIVWWQSHRVHRRIAALEAQGVRRRSAAAPRSSSLQ